MELIRVRQRYPTCIPARGPVGPSKRGHAYLDPGRWSRGSPQLQSPFQSRAISSFLKPLVLKRLSPQGPPGILRDLPGTHQGPSRDLSGTSRAPQGPTRDLVEQTILLKGSSGVNKGRLEVPYLGPGRWSRGVHQLQSRRPVPSGKLIFESSGAETVVPAMS